MRQQVAEKTSLWQNLSSMWNKWWHLHRKESFDVTASGSVVLSPPVTDCKKRCCDYRIRYDFGTGNSSQKRKHFTWYLYFSSISYFSLFIFSSFCSALTRFQYIIGKTISKCRQTSNQVAMGSPLRSKQWFPTEVPRHPRVPFTIPRGGAS